MPDTSAERLASAGRTMIGGLPIAQLDRADTAELMVARERIRNGPPPLFTSANGEVENAC